MPRVHSPSVDELRTRTGRRSLTASAEQVRTSRAAPAVARKAPIPARPTREVASRTRAVNGEAQAARLQVQRGTSEVARLINLLGRAERDASNAVAERDRKIQLMDEGIYRLQQRHSRLLLLLQTELVNLGNAKGVLGKLEPNSRLLREGLGPGDFEAEMLNYLSGDVSGSAMPQHLPGTGTCRLLLGAAPGRPAERKASQVILAWKEPGDEYTGMKTSVSCGSTAPTPEGGSAVDGRPPPAVPESWGWFPEDEEEDEAAAEPELQYSRASSPLLNTTFDEGTSGFSPAFDDDEASEELLARRREAMKCLAEGEVRLRRVVSTLALGLGHEMPAG